MGFDRLGESFEVAADHRLDQLSWTAKVVLGVEELVAGDVVETVVGEPGDVVELTMRGPDPLTFRLSDSDLEILSRPHARAGNPPQP